MNNLKRVLIEITEGEKLLRDYKQMGVDTRAIEILERRISYWKNKLFNLHQEIGLIMVECSIAEETTITPKVMFMTGINEKEAKIIIKNLYPQILEKTIKIKSLPVGKLI